MLLQRLTNAALHDVIAAAAAAEAAMSSYIR